MARAENTGMTNRVGPYSNATPRWLGSRRGQALVEYSLILAFISVLCIAVLGGFGEQVRGIFLSIISSLASAGHGFETS